MKKVLFLSLLSLPMLFASCKRDYTCECTEYYSGADTSYSKFYGYQVYENKTKKDAEATCNSNESSQTIMTETKSLDCSLQ